MELAKNQEHTVTIEGYGEGGMGVARIDGRVVFQIYRPHLIDKVDEMIAYWRELAQERRLCQSA